MHIINTVGELSKKFPNSRLQIILYSRVSIIWNIHARVNDGMLIEKTKDFGGKLKVTGFSHFVEKILF